jgi:hypothetical protein
MKSFIICCPSDVTGHVARMGQIRKERKRPLGRSRRRWMDNITMGRREIGWEGDDCIHLVQDRDQWRAVVSTVMNLLVP